jgi:Putative transposase
LAPLALQNKKVLYDLLFRASAETLLEVARDPRHLGAEIGFFTVLHTWSQKLGLHPHVHCVIPAGGLSLDHTHWVPSRDRFFLSIHVLRRIFRGKFVAGLRQAFQEGQLNFQGDFTCLAQPKIFAAWLRSLYRKDWIVYLKPPFGGPEYVLQYLGRYTHRVAISNHRLVSLADGNVTFRWRDSAHHNEQIIDERIARWSCVDSCCTCFRKASFAFGTSDSWPTAGVPRTCHSAFYGSARHRNLNKRFPLPVRAMYGFAPTVVGP